MSEPDAALTSAFRAWAACACAGPFPVEVRAFSFNLYEHSDSFAMELVGATRFDPDDQAWPCAEAFAFRDPLFEIPRTVVGESWEDGLAAAQALVREYLHTSDADHPLRKAAAVAVGFVNGDLHLVLPERAAT